MFITIALEIIVINFSSLVIIFRASTVIIHALVYSGVYYPAPALLFWSDACTADFLFQQYIFSNTKTS
jgi:predicted AlkP superfamily pyrophosphatase or phosphodiesterase